MANNIYVVNEETRAMFMRFNDADGNIYYMVNDEVVTKDEGNRHFREMKAVNGFTYRIIKTKEDVRNLKMDLIRERHNLANKSRYGTAKERKATDKPFNEIKTMLNIIDNIQRHWVFHPQNYKRLELILDKAVIPEYPAEDFPAPYYFVEMTVNMADEEDLTKTDIVAGPDMPEFLTQVIENVTFGNLELYDSDFDHLRVDDIATYDGITEQEYDDYSDEIVENGHWYIY